MGEVVAGVARAQRHTFTLPATDHAPAMPLDILLAPPPERCRASRKLPPLMVYVLDPEPFLFGLAALFAFQAAGYYPHLDEAASAEAVFQRTYVVGIGHAAAGFAGKPARAWGPGPV